MQVLVAFLAVCFVIGGSDVGRVVRDHPILLAGFSTIVAASYWMLSVVL